jgi:hypothetical protein
LHHARSGIPQARQIVEDAAPKETPADRIDATLNALLSESVDPLIATGRGSSLALAEDDVDKAALPPMQAAQ